MKNYVALSILLSGLCLNSASAGNALRTTEAQYEGNRMLATDEPTAFEPTPVSVPVSEPTKAGPTASFGDDTVCAKHDERSVQCGAVDSSRPSACCEGLYCNGKKCVDPDIVPPASEVSCASEGVRSQQCGATRNDLPATCCGGLVCEEDGGVKCVMSDSEPVSEPASDPALGDSTCAASGGRSQQCGATRSDLPATCCEGLVCEGNGSVKCVDGPLETSEPTKAPVVAPEPTAAAVAKTPAPTMIELEPTGEPTPEPTSVEIVTTSSASVIAVKGALAAAVAVPVLFF